MSMSLTTQRPVSSRVRYHREAYDFVTQALRVTQELLGRSIAAHADDDSAHVSGQELLEGIRHLGRRQFGMMAPIVFAHWGVNSTDDFGRIVFDLVEREDFRRTDRDQLGDFANVYSFDDVFRRDYEIDVSQAFPA
jgi:uncharacterized repeat protein (TIGR04138 family)